MQADLIAVFVIWAGAIGVMLGYWWGLHDMTEKAKENSGLK